MVWKQDLAKLKTAFRDAGGPPPPPPKPKPKPVEVKNLSDEDAFFLAAMGAPAPRPQVPQVAAPPVRVPVPPVPEASFEVELSDLKGLKPLARNPVLAPPTVVVPAVALIAVEAVPEPVAVAPVEVPVVPESETPKVPLRIQLAAGMAVEVDGTLDLRSHSIPDALGRLRDRVEDGALMGWRTLHVFFGEDEALHEAFLAFLTSGGAPKISRYAQAPIPMGGAQAWILYY